MVIDYDKPIDEKNDIYETYFLNLVDDRDLLSVLSDDEIVATPTPKIIYVTPEPTAVPAVTPEPVIQPEKPANNPSGLILLLMAVPPFTIGLILLMFKTKETKNVDLEQV